MRDPGRFLRDLFERKAGETGPPPVGLPPSVLRRVRRRQFTAVFTAVAVIAALAVGSFAGVRSLLRLSPQPADHPSPGPGVLRPGGSIVLGTRDFPECLNPLTGCASSTGTWWTVLEHVLPRAMEFDAKGNAVPSPLLLDGPSLLNGGLRENPFTVTYQLDPTATWADGTPITAADFDFTWRAVMHTTGSQATQGYDRIASVDTSDPKAVVITFDAVVANWSGLFGGVFGGILERAAFPRFMHDLSPDLAGEMQHDIPFSGGSWRLRSFTPNRIVLVPNARSFASIPLLDRVTIVPVADPSRAVQDLKQGSIDAFPWPAVEGLLNEFTGDPAIRAVAAGGSTFEALWFNHTSPPLDDPTVRQALLYAIDRQAVIDQVIRPIDSAAQILNCGFVAVPALGPWCATTPFERFAYDPDRARQILESDGYDCSDLPCVKEGKKLVVDYSTVSTNDVRIQVQELLKAHALPAGFEFRARNADAAVLFGALGPRGSFTMAEYAVLAEPDPSVTDLLACRSIPTEVNGYAGGNWTHWCDPRAAELMAKSDLELDPDTRLQLMQQVYVLEAGDFVSLPLFVWPDLAAWRMDRIIGPIGDYLGTPYGLFFNMDRWSLARP